MLLKLTTQMNEFKGGYTRTIGIMHGSIKAAEIENTQKTNICQWDIHFDEYEMPQRTKDRCTH